MLKIRVVTIGIRALAWIQGLSWKLMYVEMFQNGSYKTWYEDRPLS
jgi:hypothetical protein